MKKPKLIVPVDMLCHALGWPDYVISGKDYAGSFNAYGDFVTAGNRHFARASDNLKHPQFIANKA